MRTALTGRTHGCTDQRRDVKIDLPTWSRPHMALRCVSTMHWHIWVVPIAGSAGSALRAVRPPNLHLTPDVRRDLFTPQVRRVPYSGQTPLLMTGRAWRTCSTVRTRRARCGRIPPTAQRRTRTRGCLLNAETGLAKPLNGLLSKQTAVRQPARCGTFGAPGIAALYSTAFEARPV